LPDGFAAKEQKSSEKRKFLLKLPLVIKTPSKLVAKNDQLCPLTAVEIGCNVIVHILDGVEGLRRQEGD
jgi:hypothetical protein